MASLKGGIVLIDDTSKAIVRVIALQYNPETLSRTLEVQGVGTESGPHVDQLRLKGPPIEKIKVDAEIDATDAMQSGDPVATQYGIAPQIAVLEMIVYPTSAQLTAADQNSRAGTLDIAPMDAPFALFVWSKSRIVPVRITEFSVTEEFFDSSLNPIRAKISLGMRVLTIDDVPFASTAGSIYMAYQQQKERIASLAPGAALSVLGITRIP